MPFNHPRRLLWASLFLSTLAAAGEPFPSTYQPLPSTPLLIRDATVLIGDGSKIESGDVLVRDGKIVAVGANLTAEAGVTEINGSGRVLTPGIIDIHSHLGVYASPGLQGHQDGNEATDPVTPGVWAEHSILPDDPGFDAARAAGVTSMLILPGSANLIGGRAVAVRNVPAQTYQQMKFPGAPHGLKMACGENPKRVYGSLGRAPQTRMGNVAGYRQAFADAQQYLDDWQRYDKALAEYTKKQAEAASSKKKSKDQKEPGEPPKAPHRDLKLETLAGVLKGEILVQNHCYRSDEMANQLDLAKEFGFKITTFHHATEAYQIADLLAENGTCAAMWADWWGFKLEAFEGVQENIAIVDRVKNGCAIVHSDSSEGIQRLNQEAAKAMARGNAMGYGIDSAHAIRWLTENPAKAMGILDQTGTIAAGKRADLVLWNRDPFSVYALPDSVFIDGAEVYARTDPKKQHVSDFRLGTEVQP
ncbi:amidohydrolase [Ahniella affigens]|uniref:Amidohydrolase n=1 Tax=Ahniella affigens TaxID=2021234 RepID=A0A2P1PXG3_9GAMM|nr:amidohydrolase [Ahniella affigens]